MRFQRQRRSPLALAGLLAILAGCSGSGSGTTTPIVQSPVVQTPSLALGGHSLGTLSPLLTKPQSACTGPLTFVSDDAYNTIHILSGATECSTFAASGFNDPQGLAIDSSGTLYVANLLWSSVWELKPPYDQVSNKLSDPGEYPSGIAICKGYIAVTNLETNGNGPGSVSIYRGGASQPSSTLVDPKAGSEFYPACDSAGNLFTSYCTHSLGSVHPCKPGFNEGRVNEWKLGVGTPIELRKIVTQYPGGIDWYGGSLYAEDQASKTVGIYKPPYAVAVKTINLTQAGDPVSFQVFHSGQALVDADAANADAQIYSLAGPHGAFKKSLAIPGAGQPIGVATNRARN